MAGTTLAPGLRTISKSDFLGEEVVVRGNSPKLELQGFQSDIGKNSLPRWVIQPWEQFPELKESPFLKNLQPELRKAMATLT